jgi:hypothetical protein
LSRQLASIRCAKRKHLLASVASESGELIVTVRTGVLENMEGRLRRNVRAKDTELRIPASTIGGWATVLATCGCRDEHHVNLSDLVARAKSGQSMPVFVSPIHGR